MNNPWIIFIVQIIPECVVDQTDDIVENPP